MNIRGVNSEYVFSRNPIIIEDNEWQSDSIDERGGRFYINLNNKKIYEGCFFPPLSIDVSEILDANIDFYPEPPENNENPLIEIIDTGSLWDRFVYAYFEYDSFEAECEFFVVPGGISNQNFRRLSLAGKDVFTSRLFNPANNFFLTTRTADWQIVMKETELYPLYFFVQQNLETIDVKNSTGSVIAFDSIPRGVYALDIDALRRRFVDEYDELTSVFDIYMAGVHSCRIVVERSMPQKERYRLKFRNSLGVFEIIELSGELAFSPDYSASEEAVFKRYDTITGSLYSERERVERTQSIQVETGNKRPDEIRFLMDMIGSEEVYLLDCGAMPIKVIPSVEEMKYKHRQDSPESFTLNLEICDSEINILQEIVDGNEGRKPKIFSDRFNDTFN